MTLTLRLVDAMRARSLSSLALPTLFVVCAATAVGAQTAHVRGVVFLDRNGNGTRDAGEPGLADVVVSDQHDVVTTSSDGRFTLHVATPGLVYVSVPNGYRMAGDFWRPVSGGAGGEVAFPLRSAPAPRTFTFVHASDTHVSTQSVERTRRLRAMSDSLAPSFVIITGDLVKDALRVSEPEATGYYEMFGAETKQFKAPVHTVPGNHENFGIERNQSHIEKTNPLYGREMYHHYRGPDYYSFTYGGVHFIGLNTVDIDDMWYYGHVDAEQVAWLQKDLEHVPASMPIVTFDHIPFLTSLESLGGFVEGGVAPSLITINGKPQYRHVVSNAKEVLGILRKHNFVLALGGHLHTREKISFELDGVPTRFELTAAIVGPSGDGGMTHKSGFVLYRVSDGVIDGGKFFPIDKEDHVTK